MISNMIFFLLLLIKKSIKPALISKSILNTCTNDGENELDCKEKIIVTLSIENGKLSDTDYIEAYLTYVDDSHNQKKTLKYPYKIIISKTPVEAIYPAIYLQDFNYHAKERVVASDVFTCNDKDLSDNPTCGWQYDSKGNRIPNSQGFCCKCSFDQIIGLNPYIRGNSCKFFNFGTGSASAHCLSFDSLWFSGFELKQYRINYLITINVIGKTEANEEYNVESITLSPSNPISKSESGNIIGRTIGDFLPPILPDDLSNSYLLIPSYPKTHIMVREGILNWMKVKTDQISLDGNECDKIGSSYYAFRTHGGNDRCEIVMNSCLSNQLADLYASDLNAISNNQNPKYLLSQDKSKDYSFYSHNSTYKTFSYKLQGTFTSMIQLEIKADDIKYVQNVAKGTIDSLTISNFEAMSSNGLMVVQVTNIGTITSFFYLSYECNTNILPLTGDTISIGAMKTNILTKDVYSASTFEQLNNCTVELKNAIGEVVDKKQVDFNTTETNSSNNQGGGNNTADDGDGNDNNNMKLTCADYCPDFFSFPCFVVHGCWWYLSRAILILLLIALVVICLIKFVTSGMFCRCLNKIFKKSKKKKKKEKEEKFADDKKKEQLKQTEIDQQHQQVHISYIKDIECL